MDNLVLYLSHFQNCNNGLVSAPFSNRVLACGSHQSRDAGGLRQTFSPLQHLSIDDRFGEIDTLLSFDRAQLDASWQY
jgi:hypothetical protein